MVMKPPFSMPKSMPNGATEPRRWHGFKTAERLRDPGLVQVKTDVLFDPLRPEQRFPAARTPGQ
jgi:hypothetical protein